MIPGWHNTIEPKQNQFICRKLQQTTTLQQSVLNYLWVQRGQLEAAQCRAVDGTSDQLMEV